MARDEWVDPAAGNVSLTAYVDKWLRTKVELAAKTKTGELYRYPARSPNLPEGHPLRQVRIPPPTDLIPGPYEVTFKRRATNPVAVRVLRAQVTGMGLDHYAEVVGLGGKEYRTVVEEAFAGSPPPSPLPLATVSPRFPFSGCAAFTRLRWVSATPR